MYTPEILCSLWKATFQKGKDQLSTIHFQGRAVKLWGCISTKCIFFLQPVNSGNNDYAGKISPYKNHQKPYLLGIFVIYWCDARRLSKISSQNYVKSSATIHLRHLLMRYIVSAPYPFLVGTKNSIHKSGKTSLSIYLSIYIYIFTDVYQMIPYVSSTFKTHIFQAKLACPGKGV